MVSRIDIGPDGGPYVAINENSNDLELQDINGNVVAKWDETAGQWELNNNSLTGINAINASSASVESLGIDDLTDDATNILVEVDETDESDPYAGYLGLQRTNGVGTSATAIYDTEVIFPDETRTQGFYVVVNGRDSGNNLFSDLLHMNKFEAASVINSLETNSPAGRTYSVEDTDLQLAMGSDTYRVVTMGAGALTST